MKKAIIKLCILTLTPLTLAALPAVAAPKKTVQQVRQLQQKEFGSDCQKAFKAAMTTLQDNSFQIKEADPKSGFIYARTGEKKSFMLGTSKEVVTSMTFEDQPANTCLIRSNLFQIEAQRSAGFLNILLAGVSVGLGAPVSSLHTSQNGWESATLITKPKIYQSYYSQLEKNLFIKQALQQ